ncbi:MAG TPA: ABC-2 family transporter protein [Patescibacteria group bacterium]|nr:ABC-2 family transporter protein [Patescibacteria group bacterium]
MKKYILLWLQVTGQLTQIAFASRLGVVLFTLGKIIRFVSFIIFLFILISQTKSLAGYSFWQVMMFFLTFNFIDIIAQFLWRDVYRFRSYIVSGSFDMTLTKPISPLLRSLFGGSDVLDLITLFPLIAFMIYAVGQLGRVTFVEVLLYVVLLLNGLLIAMSLHIFVLSLGIVTTEVDNAIWFFRELTQLGRIPLKVYPNPISFTFTFILPVAALITIPTEALLGVISVRGVIIAVVFSTVLLGLSLKAWRGALKKYASASS